MGRDDQITRFRPTRLVRSATIAVAALPAVALAVASFRFGDWSYLPVIVVVAVATIGAACWGIRAMGVSLTAEHLVIGLVLRRITLRWAEVITVEQRGNDLWVQSRDAWYCLPLRANAVADGGGQLLGATVFNGWLRGRGADWCPEPPTAWDPPIDLRGRIVLRRPPGRSIALAISWSYIPFGQLIGTGPNGHNDLATVLAGQVVLTVVVVAIVAAHHRWARMVVDQDRVVVRSLVGISRIDRRTIVAVREEPCLRGSGRRLVIDQVSPSRAFDQPVLRSTRLPVTTSRDWLESNPAYYRIWAWLHEHVVPERPDVTGALEKMLEP